MRYTLVGICACPHSIVSTATTTKIVLTAEVFAYCFIVAGILVCRRTYYTNKMLFLKYYRFGLPFMHNTCVCKKIEEYELLLANVIKQTALDIVYHVEISVYCQWDFCKSNQEANDADILGQNVLFRLS